MFKIEHKHLIFKTSIVEVKTHLLIDNKNEIELIDEFLEHANKISTFELKKSIDFILENGKIIQQLIKKILIDVIIEDYIEQVVCYLTKLNIYTVILGNKWLHTHNLVIN